MSPSASCSGLPEQLSRGGEFPDAIAVVYQICAGDTLLYGLISSREFLIAARLAACVADLRVVFSLLFSTG
jgi:hypothetical protein